MSKTSIKTESTAEREGAATAGSTKTQKPARPRDLKPNAPDAGKILLGNVYGWFVRVERGVYALSEGGKAALVRWASHLPA